MKYWKKEGNVGTMDDDGYVPDSTEATKKEYDDYVQAREQKPKPPKTDLERLIEYAKQQGWI
ncbi:MAG: hypothetical protein KGI33_12295 [Thaumarchaeota archaeon]|nr:hypothetical protein [Nitrososphaerota archaeon]